MRWDRDNLAGLRFDSKFTWLLWPGVILLWIQYMFPSDGLFGIAKSARHARSPIMTMLYSVVFYVAVAFAIVVSLAR